MKNVSPNQTKAQIKDLVLSGILLAVGFVLHSVVPPLFFGVKPDFLLACMFVAIIASKNVKNLVAVCVAGAIISALTTGFPGGQIPNIIDKILSGIFFFALSNIIKDSFTLKTKTIIFGLIVFIATVFSGTVFLSSALAIVGLPAPLTVLFLSVVLPTAVCNIFVGIAMYLILQKTAK